MLAPTFTEKRWWNPAMDEAVVAGLERVVRCVLAEHEQVVSRARIDDRSRAGHSKLDAAGLAASVGDGAELNWTVPD
jgi:hypothetical protein